MAAKLYNLNAGPATVGHNNGKTGVTKYRNGIANGPNGHANKPNDCNSFANGPNGPYNVCK